MRFNDTPEIITKRNTYCEQMGLRTTVVFQLNNRVGCENAGIN